MTVGEFTRKLTELVHEQGYTINNAHITDITYYDGDLVEVSIEGPNEEEILLYVEN